MVQVGYADFIKLCRVEQPLNWNGLEIKHDEVYIVPPPDNVDITPEERATLSQHPLKDLTKPVLTFPCSLEELQKCLEEEGAYGYIDAFDMAEFVLESERADAAKKEKADKGKGTALTTPYLDPSHSHYSKDLAVAVKAWRTLYDKGGTYKANRSHKEQIKATLVGNGLSNAAIERIATLVNPNKDGGAPATEI